MKILLATRQFDGVMGGLERQISFLANEFVSRNHDVTLMYLSNGKGIPFFNLDERVKRVKIGPISPEFRATLLQKLLRQILIFKAIKSISPDVCVSFMTGGFYLVRLSTLILRVPCVLSERNSPAMYRLTSNSRSRFFQFLFMWTADKITVQFESFIRGYPQFLRNRIFAISNSITTSIIDRPQGKRNPLLYVFAGRFSFQKQPVGLVRAFSHFAKSHNDVKLVLYGSGELEGEILKEITRTGSEGIIEVRSPIPNIAEVIGSASAVCSPSLWEGFPNTVLESLSLGIPVVGFEACDGVSDLVIDGLNGWLAQGRTGEESLTEALERSYDDLKNSRVNFEEIRDSVAKFSPSMALSLWEDLFNQLSVNRLERN